MSSINNNSITDLIIESEKRTAEIERSMRKSDYEQSMRRAEELRNDIKQMGANAETEKYKKLYKSMLNQRNEAFNDLTTKPLSHLAKKYPRINEDASILEANLTYWLINCKGARELAIEYGLTSNKTITEIDKEINDRAIKSIDNLLPSEHGNNIAQSKNPYLSADDKDSIVSLDKRIEHVKKTFKNKS